MKFFKRKLKPLPDFATIECEFNGTTYGYFPGWFKKDVEGNIVHVDSQDLPLALVNHQITSMVRNTQADLTIAINEFRDSLLKRLKQFDEVEIYNVED